ncbi:MAG: biopolymer transporter ExbD [Gemmatimonadota bacterium]
MASAEVGGETGGGGVEASESSVMGDINVTPLVDVMLVLLIIFMIVTPAIMAGFQAQLPEGAHLRARPEEEDRTTFGVDQQGNWFLNKKPINKADAQKLLEAEFLRHPDDKVLFVKADKNLKYGQLLEVMEIAKKAGVAVFAAVTDSRPGTEELLETVSEGN